MSSMSRWCGNVEELPSTTREVTSVSWIWRLQTEHGGGRFHRVPSRYSFSRLKMISRDILWGQDAWMLVRVEMTSFVLAFFCPFSRESLCIGNYGGDYGDYYGTTAASTAAFRRQISKSGTRRWLLDVPLLVHSRKPARHLKTGPRSQKVGLVSITKVFFWGVLRPQIAWHEHRWLATNRKSRYSRRARFQIVLTEINFRYKHYLCNLMRTVNYAIILYK